mmetsp:Transcript_133105/g.297816  ORF Transcript_133105/g.297816 Transcript_133105/m.297816 type:complete len:217 (-) Transcript_133105:90-740(-)
MGSAMANTIGGVCKSACGDDTTEAADDGMKGFASSWRSDARVEVVEQKRVLIGTKDQAALAGRVRAKGPGTLQKAWTTLQAEFDVQKMVWESMGLSKGKRHQGSVAALQSKIEFALMSQSGDPDSAVLALETALQVSSEGSDLLSNSMAVAAQDAVKAVGQAQARKTLAECLEAGSLSGAKLNLGELMKKCDLKDRQLEVAIRKALAPPPQGSPGA